MLRWKGKCIYVKSPSQSVNIRTKFQFRIAKHLCERTECNIANGTPPLKPINVIHCLVGHKLNFAP